MVEKNRTRFMGLVLISVLGMSMFGFISKAFTDESLLEEVVLPSFAMPEVLQREVFHLISTAYNSLEDQTDDTPHITSIGETTRPGIIALSRDLLEVIPYGSVIEIIDIDQPEENPWGCGWSMEDVRGMETMPGLEPGQFYVADTMHIRKTEQVDVWFKDLEDAINWGRCRVAITAVDEAAIAHF